MICIYIFQNVSFFFHIFKTLLCFLGINNGIIVNINDASGLNLLPMNRNRPAYLASKCALTTLTDCLIFINYIFKILNLIIYILVH